MQNKKCSKCLCIKSINEYSKHKGGLYSCCKECKSIEDKSYREKYKEKIREKRREFWAENKDRINEERRETRKNDPDKTRKRECEYREVNRDKVRQWGKDFYYKNKNKRLLIIIKWGKQNPEKVRLIKQNYKIRRRLQIGGDNIDTEYIKILLKQQNSKCFYCDVIFGDYHLDHIVPLARGGEHKEYNVVLACPQCNIIKSAKDPEIFVNQIIHKYLESSLNN